MAVKSAYMAKKLQKSQPKGAESEQQDFPTDSELKAYHDMLLIRRFEEKAGQLYGMGFIGGFCHLYIGQEAVVVGMQMALKPGDQPLKAPFVMRLITAVPWLQGITARFVGLGVRPEHVQSPGG